MRYNIKKDGLKKVEKILKEIFPDAKSFSQNKYEQHYGRFNCKFKKECKVDPEKTPIWTPFFPDNRNSKYVVVGEAPSGSKGSGIFIGGKFSKMEDINGSEITGIREFVKENYGEIPYFVDLVLCGVPKQKDKKKLETRYEKCISNILFEMLKSVDPEKIFCLGTRTHKVLLKNLKELEEKKKEKLKGKKFSNRLVKLMHYSKQAQLPLNIEDKKKIIWEWQTGRLKKEDLKENLIKLSFFRNRVDDE